MFYPYLHAEQSLLAVFARDQASAHFDDAERELAATLALLDGVWAGTAWESPAARAFRLALLDYITSVLALQQTVNRCRWESGA